MNFLNEWGVVLSMANNRKVISVVLMFGLLLCSCAEEKLNGLGRSQDIEEKLELEKSFFQDCDGRGFIKKDSKGNQKHLRNNIKPGGLCTQPDKVKGGAKAKKEAADNFNKCNQCNNCYSKGDCPEFVKNNPLK
ncbi:MAG: hypothetical protein LE180_03410 [Endomicrobium sp.]|uniref:hypothetical protein n=1 Tax=Candidatus Endomicrobiellum pyrsonymphae TaxID=1408203 RepID=UPI0035772A7F|nr:hypothetical protein [Endomicrobium sp.]